MVHILSYCFHGGSDGVIAARGEDMFRLCPRSFRPLLEMGQMGLICKAILAFNSAEASISHSGLIFSLT